MLRIADGLKIYILISVFSIAPLVAHSQHSPDTNPLDKSLKYASLSDSCFKVENYLCALSNRKNELSLRLQLNQTEEAAISCEKIGIYSYHLGNYHSAIEYYNYAAQYYEENKKLPSLAAININKANVYTRLGHTNKAINQLLNAETIYQKDTSKYANHLMGLYINLGLAYIDQPDVDSSYYYYKKALKYHPIVKNELYYAIALNNIGDIYLEQGKLEKAKKNYNSALNTAKNLNYLQLIATAQLNLSRVKTAQNNYDDAIDLLKNALLNYSKINSLYFLTETHERLSNNYVENGNYKKAHYHLKKHNSLEDSLKGIEILDRIAQLEKEVAIQKEERKLEVIRREKEVSEAKSKYENTILYFIISLIVLGLIILILINRTLKFSLQKKEAKSALLKQEQELLEAKVQFKNKEIENFGTYVTEKNKIFEQVKHQLKELKAESSNPKLVNEILNTVSHTIRVDKDRKELDLKINQAHQEFLSRLLKKHPKLTKTEQRLCSLLLLEQSSKDISVIMNITTESVKKGRYRLRKKLNLPPKSDIISYLKSI